MYSRLPPPMSHPKSTNNLPQHEFQPHVRRPHCLPFTMNSIAPGALRAEHPDPTGHVPFNPTSCSHTPTLPPHPNTSSYTCMQM